MIFSPLFTYFHRKILVSKYWLKYKIIYRFLLHNKKNINCILTWNDYSKSSKCPWRNEFLSFSHLIAGAHAILVHIRRVNSEEHGTKVGTVRYNSPVNLVGQDSTKSVQYSTISSFFQLQWAELWNLSLVTSEHGALRQFLGGQKLFCSELLTQLKIHIFSHSDSHI